MLPVYFLSVGLGLRRYNFVVLNMSPYASSMARLESRSDAVYLVQDTSGVNLAGLALFPPPLHRTNPSEPARN